MKSGFWSWMRRSVGAAALVYLVLAIVPACQGPQVPVEKAGVTTREVKPVIGTWGSEQMWTVSNPTIHHRWQGVPAGVEVVLDQEFKRVGERAMLLDVYLPEKREHPLPAIVWVSGGGWKTVNRRGPMVVSAWLAAQGYAVVGIEYRVSSEAKFPAAIEDCKAAVRWVRANASKYHIDPDHIGVWGDSAGGHLVALMGVTGGMSQLGQEGPNLDQSSQVQAVCAFYPPADLTTMPNKAVQEFIGGTLEQKRDAFELASPITHVRAGLPPHLLVHGTADKTVPFDQSVRYAAALRKAGVEATLVQLPGVGHSGSVIYSAEEVKEIVAAFFDRTLRAPSRAERTRILKVTLNGSPAEKDVTDLYIPSRPGAAGVGNAWSWNSAMHDVDAGALSAKEGGLTGSVRVRYNPDPWVPKSGQAAAAELGVTAQRTGDRMAGDYTGQCDGNPVRGAVTARYLPDERTAVDPANCRLELALLKAVAFDLSAQTPPNSELHLTLERRQGKSGAAQAMSYQYKRGKLVADLDVSDVQIDAKGIHGTIRFSAPPATTAPATRATAPAAGTRTAPTHEIELAGKIVGRLVYGTFTRRVGEETVRLPFSGYLHPFDEGAWGTPAWAGTIDGSIAYTKFVGKAGTPISYGLYLPPGYELGKGRYPVLYHLHGAGCDETSDAAAVVRHYEKALAAGVIGPMIIVFPNGYKDAFWADTKDGAKRPESEVISELIPHIDATCRTLPRRESRGLSGMSMGGFGCTLYATKFPELFCCVTSWDGAIFNWDMMAKRNSEKQAKDLVFGGEQEYFDRYSPYAQAAGHREAISRGVAIRLVSGKSLKDANRAYYEYLVALKIPVDLMETDCPHTMGSMMTKVGTDSFAFYAKHLKCDR